MEGKCFSWVTNMPKNMLNNKIRIHDKIKGECLKRKSVKNMCEVIDGLDMFLVIHFRFPYHCSGWSG